GKFPLYCLFAADNLPLQLLAGIKIDTLRIGYMTAPAHDVEIVFLAGFAHGVIVRNPKRVCVGRLEFVEDFAVLIGALVKGILSLRSRSSDWENVKETDDQGGAERGQAHLSDFEISAIIILHDRTLCTPDSTNPGETSQARKAGLPSLTRYYFSATWGIFRALIVT